MDFHHRGGEGVGRHWWFFASLGVAATLALVLAGEVPVLVVSVVYALVNSGGVWIYCDHLEHRSPRARQWLQWLAVALVPVGFVTVFMTPVGRRRDEMLRVSDDRVRLDAGRVPNDTMASGH